MSNVYIAYSQLVSTAGVSPEAVGVIGPAPVSETAAIVSSASNQQSAITVPSGTASASTSPKDTHVMQLVTHRAEYVWRIAVTGAEHVYVAFGTNPNALTGTSSRYLCVSPGVYEFAAMEGHKVALVNA